MNKELLQERKKMIYDFICDELYVPMKAKEMAIVLNVPKSQRGGKSRNIRQGKICKIRGKISDRCFYCTSERVWFCDCGGRGRRYFHPGCTDERSAS